MQAGGIRENMIDLNFARKAFDDYLAQYDREDEKIRLKIIHTDGVIRCAEEITRRMGLSEEDRDLAMLIALLHDIGRFEQVKRFDSFMPGTMDHAAYGAELLFGPEKKIREFVKEERWDDIIRQAIARHSDFRLQGIWEPRALLHAKIIRDADKLDNCRVKLSDSLELLLGVTAREAGRTAISPKVWEACLRRESVLSSDRVTKMDFWVSYVAYFYDVNFPETFAMIKEQDYVRRTIDRIPYENPDTKKKMAELCRTMQDYVEEQAAFS